MHSATPEQLMTIHQIKGKRSAEIIKLREAKSLTPNVLTENGIMTVDFWNQLVTSNVITFEIPPLTLFSPVNSDSETAKTHTTPKQKPAQKNYKNKKK